MTCRRQLRGDLMKAIRPALIGREFLVIGEFLVGEGFLVRCRHVHCTDVLMR